MGMSRKCVVAAIGVRQWGGLCRGTIRAAAVLVAILILAPIELNANAATSGEVANVSLTPAAPGRPVSFHDRLVAGLKARRKSEVAFIDKVVAAVNNGALPQRLVDQTYFWARARVRSTPQWYGQPRRPVVYFQPALALQAKRLGVVL